MSRLSEHHKKLSNGVGKCSVPVWCNGLPAGFCDAPAYGNYEVFPETKWCRDPYTGERFRVDGRYSGFVPALACPIHGGPSKP